MEGREIECACENSKAQNTKPGAQQPFRHKHSFNFLLQLVHFSQHASLMMLSQHLWYIIPSHQHATQTFTKYFEKLKKEDSSDVNSSVADYYGFNRLSLKLSRRVRRGEPEETKCHEMESRCCCWFGFHGEGIFFFSSRVVSFFSFFFFYVTFFSLMVGPFPSSNLLHV